MRASQKWSKQKEFFGSSLTERRHKLLSEDICEVHLHNAPEDLRTEKPKHKNRFSLNSGQKKKSRKIVHLQNIGTG